MILTMSPVPKNAIAASGMNAKKAHKRLRRSTRIAARRRMEQAQSCFVAGVIGLRSAVDSMWKHPASRGMAAAKAIAEKRAN